MIRRLLRKYLGIEDKPACTRECQWDIHGRAERFTDYSGQQITTGLIYILRCKTCGDLKNHVVGGEG